MTDTTRDISGDPFLWRALLIAHLLMVLFVIAITGGFSDGA